MDIYVQGKGTGTFKPDQIVFVINFIKLGSSYEEVLKNGTDDINEFINTIIIPNGYKKEDLQTNTLNISEDTKYNSETRNYEFVGYKFNQEASLKIDYDVNKLATIMTSISKLSNSLSCHVLFSLKDEKACRRELINQAYNDALDQAEAIANAAGKQLINCRNINMGNYNPHPYSNATFDDNMVYAKEASASFANNIVNTFTPSDIELTATLNCVWKAE